MDQDQQVPAGYEPLPEGLVAVTAPLQGTLIAVNCSVGDSVARAGAFRRFLNRTAFNRR